jgi:hypothetical protein
MRIIRSSSLHEYAGWYLRREALKNQDSRPIPVAAGDQVRMMWDCHGGKMRPWFSTATRWQIVRLDLLLEFSNLVFLENGWTKREGLVIPDGSNYRLLGRVADNALASNYLTRTTDPRHDPRHRNYYNALITGSIRLEAENRIAICSAEEGERQSNPAARHYLLDGVGRSLPYMMLVKEGKCEFQPVEAFIAER